VTDLATAPPHVAPVVPGEVRRYCLTHGEFGRGHTYCETEMRLAPCAGCEVRPLGLQRDAECPAHGLEADPTWWRTPDAQRMPTMAEGLEAARIDEAERRGGRW
jgi:hypothetical protein